MKNSKAEIDKYYEKSFDEKSKQPMKIVMSLWRFKKHGQKILTVTVIFYQIWAKIGQEKAPLSSLEVSNKLNYMVEF